MKELGEETAEDGRILFVVLQKGNNKEQIEIVSVGQKQKFMGLRIVWSG